MDRRKKGKAVSREYKHTRRVANPAVLNKIWTDEAEALSKATAEDPTIKDNRFKRKVLLPAMIKKGLASK